MFGKQTKLEKVAGKELELHRRKRALLATIKTAEMAASEAILDGPADSELAVVIRAKAELNALDTAITAIRRQRDEAILELFAEQASRLREVSRKKSAEMEAVTAKLANLMREASELEGVAMVFAPDNLAPMGVLRTSTLGREIASADREAADLESKAVPSAGNVDVEVTTDDEVFIAVLQHPSNMPNLEAVESWLASCEASSRRTFGSLPRRVCLTWRNEQIDAESYIYVGALAAKSFRGLGHSYLANTPAGKREAEPQAEVYDISSATFRAAA